MESKRVLSIFGTRAEAIKMAPVILELEKSEQLESFICVTAEHRHLLDQVLCLFDIIPGYDMNLGRPGQSLHSLTAEILRGLQEIFQKIQPDIVLIQGDTTTSTASALAAYYSQIPVGHIEAGIRGRNFHAFWPKEGNRKIISDLVQIHFAPTTTCRDNLIGEGVLDSSIHVTGNTSIDALTIANGMLEVGEKSKDALQMRYPYLEPFRKLILVSTSNFYEKTSVDVEQVCKAIIEIAKNIPEVDVLYSAQISTTTKEQVQSLIKNIPNLFMVEPQDYLPFVYLMNRSYLIITDSGGIQEEASSLGKPVLLLREESERVEGVEAGSVLLVGTDTAKITSAVSHLLTDKDKYDEMSKVVCQYGDGQSAKRIVEAVKDFL